MVELFDVAYVSNCDAIIAFWKDNIYLCVIKKLFMRELFSCGICFKVVMLSLLCGRMYV